MQRMLMDMMRESANQHTIDAINEGRISLEDEVIPPFLACNLITNPQIIDILKAMNGLLMSEMEKEYVDFFLNKIQEIASKEMRF